MRNPHFVSRIEKLLETTIGSEEAEELKLLTRLMREFEAESLNQILA